MGKRQMDKLPWGCLVIGLVCLGGTLAVDSLFPFAVNAVTMPTPRSLPTPQRYQAQGLPDFDEDDALDQADLGFHSIFVDNRGNVLGTFVYIPGAKIKMFASGDSAIAEQDYTYAVEYDSRGRVRSIGNTDLTYFSNGRIRSIGDIDFAYFSRGQLEAIEDTEFRYYSNGQVSDIDDVEFEYDSTGRLKQISQSETENGVAIVVVN